MNDSYVISYLNLRKLIGILAIALPFICLFGGIIDGGPFFERSISYYYYTNMRDAVVGVLIGVGFFLIYYRGYDIVDNVITTLAGILGMLIAIFPSTYYESITSLVGIFYIPSTISATIHGIAAALFFVLLAYMSFFQFTKGSSDTEQKRKEIIYIESVE